MNGYSCFSEVVKQCGVGMTPPNDAVVNAAEDVYGEVTRVNRLGRPKTYFHCFWLELTVSSELPWKS